MTSEVVCAVSIRELPDIIMTCEEVSREKQVAAQSTWPALQSPAYHLHAWCKLPTACLMALTSNLLHRKGIDSALSGSGRTAVYLRM